ncbi:MAG: pantoate--beta-alanine ligase [Acidobacteria bacterium]|nr:pantoate--beta-alanine ligase [Acidobacteriota bacterium]
MQVVRTIADVRAHTAEARRQGRHIGFVPTMGALHDGHARLIDEARRDCDTVVVSIFVNPLQFDRREDLDMYPRVLQADTERCDALGVDVLFAPTVDEMYPQPPACTVDVGSLATHLCGPFRPGHFSGVATVVLKLFEIVRPDRAYFGEKDAQQCVVVRRLVSDLNVPVDVIVVPTVREHDGLALSSRNLRLDAGERPMAVSLYVALKTAQDLIAMGRRDAGDIRRHATETIPADERLRLEYLEIVDPDSMEPVETVTRPVLAAGALWVGSTRLIDNLLCATPGL